MSDLAPYPPQAAYKDRGTGLILIGLLELGLALLCLLMLALMLIGSLALAASAAGQPAGLNNRSMLGGALVYLFAGACLATLGIGTLRGRRWARTIGLVTSWMGFVLGVFAAGFMTFLLPKMTAGFSKAAGASADPAFGQIMVGCISVFLFLIYIALPGLLVLFYRGPNVKATFEARDSSIPWTDRVPTPVLALTLMLVFGGAATLISLSYAVFPLFGALLTGVPAILGCLVSMAICGALAWAVYQRRPAAWWTFVVLYIASCVNGVLLLLQGSAGLHRMYEAMGMSAAQLSQIDTMGIAGMYTQPAFLSLLGLAWAGVFGFLIWTRRFFTGEPVAGGAAGA
jgi:hypothetical protein